MVVPGTSGARVDTTERLLTEVLWILLTAHMAWSELPEVMPKGSLHKVLVELGKIVMEELE